MLVCGEFVCGEESSDVEVGVNSGAVEADEPKDLPEPGPQPAVVTTVQPVVAWERDERCGFLDFKRDGLC